VIGQFLKFKVYYIYCRPGLRRKTKID